MKGVKTTIKQRMGKLAHSKAERARVFKELCTHLRQGYSLQSFEPLSDTSIKTFLKTYPEEFIQEELDAALRKGRDSWEVIGRRQADGSCLGNSRSWYYNMANRYGWREKIDIEAEHKGQVNVNVISYSSLKKLTDAQEGS